MNIAQVEENIKKLINNFSEETFIYDLLLAYGVSKINVTRIRKGNSNLAKKDNQVLVKQKLFFEFVKDQNLYTLIDNLKNDPKTSAHKPRFIVVTDFTSLLAVDTRTKETLDTKINELHKHSDFFLPWSGKEKYQAHQENPADVKAAEKMAKIYDEIVRDNPDLTKNHNHSLNIFLTRLLFCFFAEDTGIFKGDQIFTKSVVEHTKEDGTDLKEYLTKLFEFLAEKNDRTKYPEYLQKFPYVNGNLFNEKHIVPEFSRKARNLIIECGELDWKEINPDIFGSMFQAVKTAEVRGGLGQHYTSVPNIMKVIEPLFLDSLKEDFEKGYDDEKKLHKLLKRIYNLKIFDPACGSGNFLIIAYKQLRILEMEVIQRIRELPGQHPFMFSRIQLNQFYGIEIDDFACEIAKLSLWLAEHQMNVKFREEFGDCNPSLPLKESGKIVCANATRINWEDVCPKRGKQLTVGEMNSLSVFEVSSLKVSQMQGEDEIYILGNPPYLGARLQDDVQKRDMSLLFEGKINGYNNLDYIACWFKKGVKYINNCKNAYFAFVTTNSICQGSQVALLWQNLLQNNVEIFFAHQSFKWTNNAKNKAGVTCVIVGMRNCSNGKKFLINENLITEAKNINGYLTDTNNIFIQKAQKPISLLPKMCFGSMPNDDGNLILSATEHDLIVEKHPETHHLFRSLLGSQEFIRGESRWCIWLEDKDLEIVNKIPELLNRVNNVKNYRMNSKREATNKLADKPYRFGEIRHKNTNSIIVPSVSSERRTYIPIGFLDKSTIISNLALAIYDAEAWVLGVVISRMHMTWVKSVGGYLGTSIRYSAEICYNTFPFPDITDKQKKIIEMHVNEVLMEREKHSEKTMAELYDPDKMPDGLRNAHNSLDTAIELCYPRQRPFDSDEKRLEYLFKMYEIMTNPGKTDSVEQLSLL